MAEPTRAEVTALGAQVDQAAQVYAQMLTDAVTACRENRRPHDPFTVPVVSAAIEMTIEQTYPDDASRYWTVLNMLTMAVVRLAEHPATEEDLCPPHK